MTTQHQTTSTARLAPEDLQYIESHLERINGLVASFMRDLPDTDPVLKGLLLHNVEWGTDAISNRLDWVRTVTTIEEVAS